MTSQDLLERRSDRGDTRGAANVWANAQMPQPQKNEPAGSWAFRSILAIALVVALFAVISAVGQSSETATEGSTPETPTAAQDPSDPSDAVLPLPILVDGAALTDTSPQCLDFRLGCEVVDSGNTGFPGNELGINNLRTTVYAKEDNPFSERVLGVENFDDGFRTWSLNTDDDTHEELVEQLVLEGGEWVLPVDSGLVEVARFDEYPEPLALWQFNFQDGARRILLQSLPSRFDQGATEWEWIVPLVSTQPDVDLRTFEVLGTPGVVIEISQEQIALENGLDPSELALGQELIWVDGDFIYRFNANGPELSDNDVDDIAERLMLVDRDVWLDAVDDTTFDEDQEALIIFGVLGVIVLIAIAALIAIGRLIYERGRASSPTS